MALTAGNVRVAGTGNVFKAPAGTALATDHTTALNAAFKDLGYYTEDGFKMNISKSSTDIKAHNGDVVRTVTNEHKVTFDLTMMEWNLEAAKAEFGSTNVVVATGTTIKVNSTAGDRGPFVLEAVDGATKMRIVIPDGQIVTDSQEVTFNNTSSINFPLSIVAYPDGTGNKAYIYTTALT